MRCSPLEWPMPSSTAERRLSDARPYVRLSTLRRLALRWGRERCSDWPSRSSCRRTSHGAAHRSLRRNRCGEDAECYRPRVPLKRRLVRLSLDLSEFRVGFYVRIEVPARSIGPELPNRRSLQTEYVAACWHHQMVFAPMVLPRI